MLTSAPSSRRLHASWLCPHRRGWRLRRMVLPLPRFSLRHLRPYKERPRPPEPRNSPIRLPRGWQAGHRLNQGQVRFRSGGAVLKKRIIIHRAVGGGEWAMWVGVRLRYNAINSRLLSIVRSAIYLEYFSSGPRSRNRGGGTGLTGHRHTTTISFLA